MSEQTKNSEETTLLLFDRVLDRVEGLVAELQAAEIEATEASLSVYKLQEQIRAQKDELSALLLKHDNLLSKHDTESEQLSVAREVARTERARADTLLKKLDQAEEWKAEVALAREEIDRQVALRRECEERINDLETRLETADPGASRCAPLEEVIKQKNEALRSAEEKHEAELLKARASRTEAEVLGRKEAQHYYQQCDYKDMVIADLAGNLDLARTDADNKQKYIAELERTLTLFGHKLKNAIEEVGEQGTIFSAEPGPDSIKIDE